MIAVSENILYYLEKNFDHFERNGKQNLMDFDIFKLNHTKKTLLVM